MIFNYKRVSTIDQSTERQLLNIKYDREFEDKLSGKDRNVMSKSPANSIIDNFIYQQ